MSNEFDTNVDNYTLAELLTILSLDTPTPDRETVTNACDKFILKFQRENNSKLVIFFEDIKQALLEYVDELENSNEPVSYRPTEEQTENWWKNQQVLPQTDEIQNEKITQRGDNVDIETYNNTHMPMNREQLGVANVKAVDVAQDKLNPTLTNVTTRIISLDSQYRQVTGPNDTSTDYTLDLSEHLVNVLSLKPYSFQVPYTWYTIDTANGNTCFWISFINTTTQLFDKTVSVSLDPGNYTTTSIVTTLNTSFTNAGFSGFSGTGNPVSYNSINGKITLNLYGGIYTDPKTSTTYNITETTIITFFDPTDEFSCSSNTCKQTNLVNQTLGWTLGYRLPYINVSATGNVAPAIINLIGPKYLIIVLDDLNQNHINNGLVAITELSKTVKLPTYYSRDLPVRCTPANPLGTNFDANSQFLVEDINAGTLIMDKWDVSYVATPTVLPTAPRILTQSQIYSINQIIKNNERSVKYRASAPTLSDIFAVIPLGKKDLKTGDLYVDDSSTLQLNKRIYFGPVNIDRMRVKLLDDKGNVLNLNGADWCLTIVAEILYQY
uniref:Uncharacterized protein n=1 Tax=viral metagenome TaxID=1070528 RepID=A0A6C0BXG9_9ZZZZ